MLKKERDINEKTQYGGETNYRGGELVSCASIDLFQSFR